MIRRIQTDTIKVEGRLHRFTLYFDTVSRLTGQRVFGQRPIVMHKGYLLSRPNKRY